MNKLIKIYLKNYVNCSRIIPCSYIWGCTFENLIFETPGRIQYLTSLTLINTCTHLYNCWFSFSPFQQFVSGAERPFNRVSSALTPVPQVTGVGIREEEEGGS